MRALRAVEHGNSGEKAYAYIKDGLLTLKFRQRDRLITQELAEQLEISRTPVREALARLEQEGLVARDGGWGYVVPSVTTADVLNLYRVREVLEVEAIHEAVQRIDEHLVSLLGTLIEKAEAPSRARRFSEFQALNRQFYALIAQATGNALLQQMLRTISDRIRILGAVVMEHDSTRIQEVMAENRVVFDALKRRNAPQAEDAIRKHIHQARNHMLLYLASKQAREVIK